MIRFANTIGLACKGYFSEKKVKRGKLTSFWLFRFLVALALGALAGCLGVENRISQKIVLPDPSANRPISSLAISEIAGMPVKTATRLRAHLKAELASRGITLVDSPQKAAYSLKAFTSAASDRQGLTLVNIWEVLDKDGRRAHRFIKEETGPAAPASDPWAGVNSTMLNALAINLARDYKAWSIGSPAPARPARPTVRKKSVRIASAAPLVTGSIPLKAHSRTVLIAPLTGAPGDGNIALAAALKSALGKRGYKVLRSGQRAAYTVNGKVYVAPPKSGRQNLAIDWKVTDSNNHQIGVINQRNTVKARALARHWGATASGAAKAAAKHIAGLLR